MGTFEKPIVLCVLIGPSGLLKGLFIREEYGEYREATCLDFCVFF